MSKGTGKTARARAKGARNSRGQFKPGHTGNPKGRPTKEVVMPKTFPGALGAALSEEVPIQGPEGKPQMISLLELCLKTAVRGAPKMKPKEIMWLLQQAQQCGAFDAMREQAEAEIEPIFTEEDHQLLALINRPVVDEEELLRQRTRLEAHARSMQRHHEEQGEPLPDVVRDCLSWVEAELRDEERRAA